MAPHASSRQTLCRLAVLCCATALAPCQEPNPVDPWTLETPTLDPGAATAWRTRIEPAAHENAFENMGWLPTLWEGVEAADAQQKPLLLWVMNGHPLACT